MVCKLGALIESDTLPDYDRKFLGNWVATGLDSHGQRVSADVLSTALAAEGFRLGSTTLKHHRASRCACYRKASP